MKLKKIIFKNWVCHKLTELSFNTGGFLILTGPNGSGKSMILEGIRFLFGGNIKLRGSKWSDYISYGEKYARVEGVFEVNGEEIRIAREVRWSESGSDIRFYLNGKSVSKKRVTELLKKYLPDPSNPFIIADSTSLHFLREQGPLGYSPEGLLRYLEKGIYVDQIVLDEGKEFVTRMPLEQLRLLIDEQYEKVKDKIRIFEEIKARLIAENKKLLALKNKLAKLQEKRRLREKLRELEKERIFSTIKEKREEINSLRDEIKELKKERNSIKRELEKVNKELKSLMDKRDALHDRKTDLEAKLLQLEKKKEGIKKIIEDSLKDVNLKEEEIKTRKAILSKREILYHNELKKLSLMESKIEVIKKEVDKINSEIEELKDKLDKLKEKKLILDRIESLENEIKRKSIRIKKMKEQIFDWRRKKNEKIKERNQLESKIHEIEKKLVEFEEKYGLLGLETEKKLDTIKKLKRKLEEKRQGLMDLLSKKREKKSRIEQEIKENKEIMSKLSFQEKMVDDASEHLKKEYNIDALPLYKIIEEISKDNEISLNELYKRMPLPELLNALIIREVNYVPLSVIALKEFLTGAVKPIHIPLVVGDTREIKEILEYVLVKKEESDDIYKALESYDETITYVNVRISEEEEEPIVIHTFLNLKAIYIPWITSQAKIAGIIEKIKSLEEDLNKTVKEISDLEVELEKLEEDEKDLDKILELENEFERLLSVQLEPIKMVISSIEKQISEKEEEIKSYEKEREKLREELRRLYREIGGDKEKIKRELTRIPNDIAKKKKEKQVLEEGLSSQLKMIESQKKVVEEIKIDVEKEKALIKQLEKEKENLVKKIDEYQNNIGPIDAEISKINREIEILNQEIMGLDTKIAKIENVDKFNTEINLRKLESEIDRINKVIQKKENELKALETRAKSYGSMPEKIRDLDEIERDIYKIHILMEEKFRGIDDNVEIEYKNTKSLIKRLKKELDEIEREKDELTQYIKALENKYFETLNDTLARIEDKINKIFEETGVGKKCKMWYITPAELNNKIGGVGVLIYHSGEEDKAKSVQTLSSGEYTLWVIGLIASLQQLNPSKIYVYDELLMHLDEQNLKLAAKILQSNLKRDIVIVIIVPLKTEDLRSITSLVSHYKIYLLWKSKGTTESKLVEIPPYREVVKVEK